MNIYSKKLRWKQLLVLIAIAIAAGSLVYTNQLADELASEERKKVELWAKGTKFLASVTDDNTDISFVFEVVKDNITIPLILTDGEQNVISMRNFDEELAQDSVYQLEQLARIRNINEAISIDLTGDSKNLIFYDNSNLYYQLKYYPFISLGIVSIFILVAYFAFSISRRAEQDQVWVGMAKETAHQLGTPISSLIGWIEYLRLKEVPEETLADMQKDLTRLETITERFSKIGSKPELIPTNLPRSLATSIDYMKSRTSSKVKFNVDLRLDDDLEIPLNEALFAWVIENLCRNAVDAMEGTGIISILAFQDLDQLIIEVNDTGKGIPRSKYKTVFEPGYTSKKRGWGLGLSLCRRIIEQYHGGRILVKDSTLGKGTTFKIVMNVVG
ncbi:MAG: signal transduction histidine kinase [Bacteroidia bacterium]